MMKCSKCGCEVKKGKFCPECGTEITNVQEKIKGGFKTVLSFVGSGIGILLIILVLSGAFDDATDGASGKGDSKIKTELTEYQAYTEEELVDELGVEINDLTGYYPNDEEINFMCTDGKIYLIRIHGEGDEDKSIFGIKIGDDIEDVEGLLKDKFELLDSAEVASGEYRKTYINKNTLYSLTVDFIDDEVVGVGYLLEENEYITQDESIGIVYGSYEKNDGVYICNVEVSFASGDGTDYMNIYGESIEGRASAGDCLVLIPQSDGTYIGKGTDNGTSAIITFTEGAMMVEILYSDLGDASILSGEYTLTSELDLNNVG